MPKILEKVKVIPSGKALGAEIQGVDLRRVSDDAFQQIEKAWNDHLVIVFRKQSLTDEEFMAFGKRFGDLEIPYVSSVGQPWIPETPEMLVVSNVKEDGKPIGALGDGEAVWHSDMTYREEVPIAALLYSLEVPEKGGDTSFSNLYLACKNLPVELKSKIKDSMFVHDNAHNSAGELRIGYSEVTNPKETPGPHHPVICRHPKSGKEYLLLGRRPYEYVVGFELEESEQILDEIWAHSTQPKFTWTHTWQPGDVLVWDNRCTLHRRDAFDPTTRRVMHRLQIKGERPIPAVA